MEFVQVTTRRQREEENGETIGKGTTGREGQRLKYVSGQPKEGKV